MRLSNVIRALTEERKHGLLFGDSKKGPPMFDKIGYLWNYKLASDHADDHHDKHMKLD